MPGRGATAADAADGAVAGEGDLSGDAGAEEETGPGADAATESCTIQGLEVAGLGAGVAAGEKATLNDTGAGEATTGPGKEAATERGASGGT